MIKLKTPVSILKKTPTGTDYYSSTSPDGFHIFDADNNLVLVVKWVDSENRWYDTKERAQHICTELNRTNHLA